MTIEIREAVETDAGVMAALSAELGYPVSEAGIAGRIVRLVGREDAAVFVAESENTVIGWAHVREAVLVQADPFAELGGLVVTSERRGERVGERLLDAAEHWAEDRGLGVIRVRSNVVRERAHGFYERLGYEVEKTSRTFIKPL